LLCLMLMCFASLFLSCGKVPDASTSDDTTTTTLPGATEPLPVKVFIVSFAGEGVDIESQEVFESLKATAPADPVLVGHNFLGWYLGDVLFDFNSPIRENITLEAKWEKATYTVRFLGLDDEVLFTQTLEWGETFKKPTSPSAPTGMRFMGWLTDTGDAYTFGGTIRSSFDLYANFAYIEYEVNFLDQNGNSLGKMMVRYGETVTPPYPPAVDGYLFLDWVDDYTGEKFDFTQGTKSPLTIRATYREDNGQGGGEEVFYTVRIVDTEGFSIGEYYVEAGNVMPMPTLEEGITVSLYTLGGVPYDFSSPVNQDIELIATATYATHTVTYVDDDNQVITTVAVEHGHSATLPPHGANEDFYYVIANMANLDRITSDRTIMLGKVSRSAYENISFTPADGLDLGACNMQSGSGKNLFLVKPGHFLTITANMAGPVKMYMGASADLFDNGYYVKLASYVDGVFTGYIIVNKGAYYTLADVPAGLHTVRVEVVENTSGRTDLSYGLNCTAISYQKSKDEQ
ncbi:MAG: InlB B-repeat-containing protein, partial [Clostridia bacterium]|nr:InlB B-repeat-containing protein [Clostridia bacterium]